MANRPSTAAEANSSTKATSKGPSGQTPGTFTAARDEMVKVLALASGESRTEKTAIQKALAATGVAMRYNMSRLKEEHKLTHDADTTHKAKHPSTDFDRDLFQAIARACECRAYPTEGLKSRKMVTFGDEQSIAAARGIFGSMTKLVWYAALDAHKEHYGKGHRRELKYLYDFCRKAVSSITKQLQAEHAKVVEGLSHADQTRLEAWGKALDEYVTENKALIVSPQRGRAAKPANLAAARAAKNATKQSAKGGVEVTKTTGSGRVRRAS